MMVKDYKCSTEHRGAERGLMIRHSEALRKDSGE